VIGAIVKRILAFDCDGLSLLNRRVVSYFVDDEADTNADVFLGAVVDVDAPNVSAFVVETYRRPILWLCLYMLLCGCYNVIFSSALRYPYLFKRKKKSNASPSLFAI